MGREGAKRAAALVLVVPLAFAWHFLGVLAFFPIGGADFHWIFQRPHGGSVEAVYFVAGSYALVAAALALFLLASARTAGVSIVVLLVLVAALLNPLLVGFDSPAEVALGAPVAGVPLSLVALLLWVVRSSVPRLLCVVVAAIPGTWFLWEVYSFPYRNSAAFRQGTLPLLFVYPLPFVAWALLVLKRDRASGPHLPGAAALP